ncbi:alpha/beta fold hydrolase [Ruania alba]|uniref:Pimeloyl-ACP methyl ester carboxylesterase n=1 Tax=Ruania alba TaxID=648782 RepID=A0A1H5N4B4_9MICO|nr:alpha/beta hydrolase [Ruania alba]SEE95731.1 Pimeloyl-ACP methyl ester carboxylesterase [Ruania alba]
MDIILLAGLWLPRTIWDETVEELQALGHRPITPALPGADDGDATATLEDQVAAVLEAVDAADGPVVVGHSAAATLAWIAADRRPERVARVMLIGGFPAVHGAAYADFFPLEGGVMPFPGWGPFEGPDADDLDAAARQRIEQVVVPVPGQVAQGEVSLTDTRRFDVPVTEICPEFSPDEMRGWMDAGDIPELAQARQLDVVEIASGHWPMVTKPIELAELLGR